MDRVGSRKVEGFMMELPVAAGEKIEPAELVGLNADGYAEKATKKENLKIVGIARERADNTTGADGDVNVAVENGAFVLKHDGKVEKTDILKTCYVEDAKTVTLTTTGSSKVGEFIQIEANYAAVLIQP